LKAFFLADQEKEKRNIIPNHRSLGADGLKMDMENGCGEKNTDLQITHDVKSESVFLDFPVPDFS
jgi:hypothetical protein